jgi:diguanylate cyclase (GGDEF)-like protein
LSQALESYFRQADSARQHRPGPLKETAVARIAGDPTGPLTARLDQIEEVERELLGLNRAREQQRLHIVEQLLLGAVAVAEAALLWALRYSWRLLRMGENEVRQLQTRASLDPLTQLLNRGGLDEFMTTFVRQLSINRGQPVALLALDLDDFKPVNDRFGHAAGDEVLQAVARRLEEQCRSGDAVARVGGDEFVVVLRSVSSQGAAVAIAERIRSRIREPVELDAATVSVDTSIGIAMLHHGEADAAAALRVADKYLYLAKRSGKGTIRVGDSPAD